jgi:hypothetical protein
VLIALHSALVGFGPIWLDLPWKTVCLRMAERVDPQPLSWVRGRYPNVRHLGSGWTLPRWHLDATQPLAQLRDRLANHPALLAWRQDGAAVVTSSTDLNLMHRTRAHVAG